MTKSDLQDRAIECQTKQLALLELQNEMLTNQMSVKEIYGWIDGRIAGLDANIATHKLMIETLK